MLKANQIKKLVNSDVALIQITGKSLKNMQFDEYDQAE